MLKGFASKIPIFLSHSKRQLQYKKLNFFAKSKSRLPETKFYHGSRGEGSYETSVNENILNLLTQIEERPNPTDRLDAMAIRGHNIYSKPEQRTLVQADFEAALKNFLKAYRLKKPEPLSVANLIKLISKDTFLSFSVKDLRPIIEMLDEESLAY
jgi:hypothetical protein